MNFGQAIEAMKAGKKVRRSGWNGKGMYLWLLPAATIPSDCEGTPVWIPRSMIERITKFKEVPGQWRECEADMQEWFAEKKGLM